MKPIYNKTGLENLLDLIRISNPGLDINASQVVTTKPVTDELTGRTSIRLIAILDKGYSNEVALTYGRTQLSNYLTDGEYLQIEPTLDLETLKETLASTLGLVKSEFSLTASQLPDTSENNIVVVDLTATDGVIYGEEETVSVYLTTFTIVAGDEMRMNNNGQIRVTADGLARGLL